jgi:lipopolysaccharide transport system ATP-binding protein
MSSAALKIDRLGKRYQVGHDAGRVRYRTLRETLMEWAAHPVRRLKGTIQRTDPFWALQDVSLEIPHGEILGIIGRNGAGKSTLLKILSRITKPSVGRVEVNGRVGSLLEVGTGFHPELTGRENVFLNGSILGMSRGEIARKFDEIVAFAEVERFLDTPVKRYSSGMYVRLAFAVAAHLEPEILIVDEVLAVGDASFQRRCLERMGQLARSGATVLLVSHNLQIVPTLCNRAVLLEGGRVRRVGPAEEVIDEYINANLVTHTDLSTRVRTGNGRATFTGLQLLNGQGQPVQTHESGEDLILRMTINAREAIRDVALATVLQSLHGARLMTSWTKEAGFRIDLRPGTQAIDCRFHHVRLRPGHQFTVSLWMATQDVIDSVQEVQVVPVLPGERDRHFSTSLDQGMVLCDYTWSSVQQ